ncbi:NlpC/P60 family protein [Streptomyces sp. NPDC053499]|uniref:C40 family peptidase n=1 Tax=Streptomyces sp. NPDC053499 TaxID=3365707 RepID=UPI0037D767B2
MASHRSPRRTPQPGQGWPARVTVLSAAAAGAAAVLVPAAPAGAKPDDQPSAAGLNSRIDRLYEEAEVATEKYNGVAERAGKLREQVANAQDGVARGQAKVNRLRDSLGSLAGAQYRSGGLDPAVALMLTEDPDSYLDKAATLDRIGSRQAARLRQLQSAQRHLAQQRNEAAAKLERLDGLQRSLKQQKKDIQKKLAAARRLLDRLTPEQRANRDGHRPKSASGVDLGGAKPSSERAAAAVAAVKSAVGRPYAWGAAGPGSFDCSGLTQWAYKQAGTSIPRTSQAQRSAGRQVPLSQARPGDLVIYRDDASHVGMYVGGGQVVHAPHPGAPVRYDPVGMMPVSSVTRP